MGKKSVVREKRWKKIEKLEFLLPDFEVLEKNYTITWFDTKYEMNSYNQGL